MGYEFIVAIVAIACATSLIKEWINRDKNSGVDEEGFDRLAKAFMQHKKEMQERVQNLEAIIAEDEENKYSQIETPDNESSLTNDLQEKNRVQS